MQELFTILRDVGFPIFVAVYLLVRLEVLCRQIAETERQQAVALERLVQLLERSLLIAADRGEHG